MRRPAAHAHMVLAGTAPSLVSVPTHFYKVVAATGCKTAASSGDNRTGVAAFVMPNAPIDPKTPLSAFVVPLEALEAASGKHGRTSLCHVLSLSPFESSSTD